MACGDVGLCAYACVCIVHCPAYQVYRGKWCNIDIAAKEYLPVDDGEFEHFNTDQESTEAARNRAKVSYAAGAAVIMPWHLLCVWDVEGHVVLHAGLWLSFVLPCASCLSCFGEAIDHQPGNVLCYMKWSVACLLKECM